MLIDHIGAVLFPGQLWLRIIGRIAFPIYCFLLAEGIHKTRNPLKYLSRLFIGIFLSELPFDFALFGKFTWDHQSVMVTLFLGALMLLCMQQVQPRVLKVLLVLPFAWIAEVCNCDYSAMGILLIAVYGLIPTLSGQLVGTLLLCVAQDIRYVVDGLEAFPGWPTGKAIAYIFKSRPPIETLATAAMVPIGLYNRQKLTHSKALQWGFYLFYPIHLTLLWVISNYLL